VDDIFGGMLQSTLKCNVSAFLGAGFKTSVVHLTLDGVNGK
jgi:hypothetical protein